LSSAISFLSIAFIALVVTPTTADAAPRLWVSVGGGYGTYEMSDINRDVRRFNEGEGTNMDEVDRGPAIGLQAGVSVMPGLDVGAGFERVFASTDVAYPAGSRDFDFSANAFCAFANYGIMSQGEFLLSVGAGIGGISATGKVEVFEAGHGTSEGDITGSGLLLQGHLAGEYYVAPRISLVPLAGYRSAEIEGYEINGAPLYNPDGSKESLDYDGVILRIAVKFALTGES
jgi:opacity protein-like surface antigen